MEVVETVPGSLFLQITLVRVDLTVTTKKKDFFCSGKINSKNNQTETAQFNTTVKTKNAQNFLVFNESFSFYLSPEVVPIEIKITLFEKHHLHKAELITSFTCTIEKPNPEQIQYTQSTDQGSLSLLLKLLPSVSPSTSPFSSTEIKASGLKFAIKGKYENTKEKLRPKYPVYTYNNVVEFLNTGDIILFRGIEMHSKVIQAGTLSYWSHASILIREPPEDIKEMFGAHKYDAILEKVGQTWDKKNKHEDIYVYESDYLPIDLREGGGCQLVPLKVWLIDYEDYYSRMHCVIRRLVIPKRKESVKYDQLWDWMRKTAKINYKISTKEMVLAVGKLNRQENLQSVFCSELVAATLKYMGVLPETMNCSNITPKDFDKLTYNTRLHIHHYGKEDIELILNSRLMDPIRIVFNPQKYTAKVKLRLDIDPIIKKEEPE